MEQAKTRITLRFARRVVRLSAYAYLAALAAVWLALVRVGESHWVTAGLLYLPRVVFAAPLFLQAPLLWLTGSPRLLWTQALALLIVLFPLMGLVLPGTTPAPAGPTLKLLSLNVDSAHAGAEPLLSVIDAAGADLVLLQEAPWGGPLHDGLRQRFAYVDESTEFALASRFPILERVTPDPLPTEAGPEPARFVRYLIRTNLGNVAVYNLHPISPRGALGVYRFRDTLHRLRTGKLLEGDAKSELADNAELRQRQVAAAAAVARRELVPVIIAGDTNLPGLSATLHRDLAGFSDGFRSASWGFGYTFPAKQPFLRLDRVLASPSLAFSEFAVGCPGVSDHLCITARLFHR